MSIIIPARNEERNIARAVRSVAAQQGLSEIIVADDQSNDRTGEILEELRREVPALRVIRVDTLPEGWLGKTHALATAANRASGEWLLFTDADTEHLAGSLEALLDRAEKERADLLSVSPGQQTPTWWEKSVIPLVYVELAKLYRFEDVSDPASPVAAANGQFMLIRREAYDRAGGHRAVRNEVLEDVELARCVKSSGGRVLFLPGAQWVRTRMYESFSAMWRGWTKNLYLLYGGLLSPVSRTLVRICLAGLAPPVVFLLLCSGIALGRGGATASLAALTCFMLALLGEWNYGRQLARLGFDARLASYQLPGNILFLLLLLNSALAHRFRRRIEWKGRVYPTGGN